MSNDCVLLCWSCLLWMLLHSNEVDWGNCKELFEDRVCIFLIVLDFACDWNHVPWNLVYIMDFVGWDWVPLPVGFWRRLFQCKRACENQFLPHFIPIHDFCVGTHKDQYRCQDSRWALDFEVLDCRSFICDQYVDSKYPCNYRLHEICKNFLSLLLELPSNHDADCRLCSQPCPCLRCKSRRQLLKYRAGLLVWNIHGGKHSMDRILIHTFFRLWWQYSDHDHYLCRRFCYLRSCAAQD